MARLGGDAGQPGRIVYVCQACGYESPKWLGRCPNCTGWNTLVEEVLPALPKSAGGRARATGSAGGGAAAVATPITEVALGDEPRVAVGIGEVDRVLGGGLVPGSLVLIGGDPGVGKSTLALGIAHHIAAARAVLYVSGEESARQTKMRAGRLGVDAPRLLVLAETDLTRIIAQIADTRAALVIIDSIQTMYRPDLPGAPGSVGQIRECTGDLLRVAKTEDGPAILIVGHVTKDGAIAGPRVLEHMVDTVLYFEGERHHAYRVLRATKNRFGSTNEIGVFAMGGRGLSPVPDPSALFLAERPADAPGSAVVCAIEGTRPILLEVQALVTRTPFGMPRRTASGVDYNRMLLLLAVLEKRAGLHLGACDVYVSVAGGVRVDEPAADLGVACAVAGSHRDRAVEGSTAVVGEVGLGGEIRAVSQIGRRVAEAAKLGFRRVVLPQANLAGMDADEATGVELVGVARIGQALELLLG
ncbi:MAG TPA: DNA repair protein RadA [bacterium]|nr:DNA repair protein RadA [bacterium]